MRDLPEDKMIFIDETPFWVGMSREFARSEKGKKAFCLRPFYKGRKMILIIEQAVRGFDFRVFIIMWQQGLII